MVSVWLSHHVHIEISFAGSASAIVGNSHALAFLCDDDDDDDGDKNNWFKTYDYPNDNVKESDKD